MYETYQITVSQNASKYFYVKANTEYEAKCFIEKMHRNGHINMKDADIEFDIHSNGAVEAGKNVIDLTSEPYETLKSVIECTHVTVRISDKVTITYTDRFGKTVTKTVDKYNLLSNDVVAYAAQVAVGDISSGLLRCLNYKRICKLTRILKANVRVFFETEALKRM